jgi:hypothetical protein
MIEIYLMLVFGFGFSLQIFCFYLFYKSSIAYSKDQAESMKKLLELLQKEFKINQDQHTELLETLTNNDQKLADTLTDAKKNIFNLAIFLGYRPRNLEEI